MPRTPEQNQEIREATRARLVDTALTLFAERGYANTSIRNIAERTGVSPGLLYHYFSGKESLLAAVFDNTMTVISAGFVPALQVDDPVDRIARIVRYIFSALREDRIFWGLFYGLRSQPAVMEALGDSFRLWTGRLRDMFVTNLRASGRATPEIDSLMLYSLIEGTIHQYLLDPERYPLGLIVERIIAQYGRPTNK